MNASDKFPAEFVKRIIAQLGSEAEKFFEALCKEPVTSVRINPFKPTGKFDSGELVPWCHEGRYLEKRPSFIYDPLFHAGTYYVQDASSMFISEIFRQFIHSSARVLDLCASPGGKSTLILSEITKDSLLISNETIRSRLPALSENIIKWGVPNVVICRNDPEAFSMVKNYFDVMLVDAPCSGEGLFRKDEKASKEWSLANVELCAMRQKRIIKAALESIKEGGILIYSTCTFSPLENDANVRYIAETGNFETLDVTVREEWNITRDEIFVNGKKFYALRFYPHKVKGEGFFVSVFKKTNENYSSANKAVHFKPKRIAGEMKKISSEWKNMLTPWLKNTEDYDFYLRRDFIYALKKIHSNDLFTLLERFSISSFGICIGKISGAELIPSHDLALSIIISDKIQSLELNEENALRYLKKLDLKIQTDLKGWTLVRFKGHNLGWIKILENRINNYFPKELRILK